MTHEKNGRTESKQAVAKGRAKALEGFEGAPRFLWGLGPS